MNNGHGGNLRDLARRAGRPAEAILDFSANVNPLGPPDCLRPVISRAVERLVHYPDPASAELVEAIARRYRLPASRILVGNGSTEILFALTRAVGGARHAVIPVPSYVDYEAACRLAGMDVQTLALSENAALAVDWPDLARHLAGGDMVFLGQPNNPTGLTFNPDAFRRLAGEHPATTFVVDEAFIEFITDHRSLADDCPANVVVLRSLTKFYAIPGLRLGFAVAAEELAERIRRQMPNWSVNTLAQSAGVAVLADGDYARRTVDYVRVQREALAAALAGLGGLHVYPGQANYLLVRVDRGDLDAAMLAERLLADGIAVRTFAPGQHLDGRFFRVAVRTEAENGRLVESLSKALGATPSLRKRKRRAATIMLQGTSSNAGKSVLAAALCRILLQDGLRVAPFKSQNMSLNSFVTRDGGEMGRAQVVQAQACRLEPDVRFNPVLLKPNSDTGSQVIVRGRPVGNMPVWEYFRYKPAAFDAAKECFDSLADEFDAVVLEGAGSPGEVNLKGHDIVNMRMAEYAAAPVLIVGDIDRGGVFAAFVGTMEVLSAWERALVAGWIVNRFRGDASLLGSALDYTLAHTGRPVLGVVPFIRDLGLPQEDSVEFKERAARDEHQTLSEKRRTSARRRSDASSPCASSQDDRDEESLDIAVIDLPHISNFTDFDAFEVEADCRVRIVRSAADLGSPDAVIIPGSKNTLGDLAHLKRSGLADAIASRHAAGGCEVVGLCGGFQMLGRRIADPHAIESAGGHADGLSLLAVETVLAADKTLVRATARHAPSGLEVVGYEIHHGRTAPCVGTPDARVASPFARTAIGNRSSDASAACGFATAPNASTSADGDQLLGAASADHRVWGTYLHGVFDADPFRRWWLDRLRARRGWTPVGSVGARYDIEPALDRLADVVRGSLNMAEVYRLLRL